MTELDPTSGVTQYLSFAVAEDAYAVRVLQVQEIIEYTDTITRVPNAPATIRGVINLRGRVVPVIDLALKLGLPATVPTRRTCILIVETRPGQGPALILGVLADSVDQVIDLAPGDIQPPPAFGAPVRTEFLEGLGTVAERFLLLLRLDELLGAEDAAAIRQEPALLAATTGAAES